MIKADKGLVEIEGYTSRLLADLTGIVVAMREKIPEDLIMVAVGLGLSNASVKEKKNEEERLAEEFIDELIKKVREKREAKDAQAD